ncbi:MAG: hypothetical protein JWO06_3430, partial [Bacteroidota bacterium]|nr:hypothetical protein [Bacteroidota bacterium]
LNYCLQGSGFSLDKLKTDLDAIEGEFLVSFTTEDNKDLGIAPLLQQKAQQLGTRWKSPNITCKQIVTGPVSLYHAHVMYFVGIGDSL